MWILFTLVYSFIKGARDLIKKKALQRSSAGEVLLLYSAVSFLLVLPEIGNAMQADFSAVPLAALKALILFAAYLCAFNAIKNLPISLYGVVDLSRMMFAIVLGVAFLNETMGMWQMIGMILVAAGILLLKKPARNIGEQKDVRWTFVFLAFLQSFLNACSSILDKIASQKLNSGQLQFWFMLFLVLFYILYAIFTKLKIDWKNAWKNYWIYIISILFVFADRLIFMANGQEESQVVIMTLIKRSSCLVTIVGGRLFFKEKNIGYKLFCACIVLLGILLAVLVPA